MQQTGGSFICSPVAFSFIAQIAVTLVRRCFIYCKVYACPACGVANTACKSNVIAIITDQTWLWICLFLLHPRISAYIFCVVPIHAARLSYHFTYCFIVCITLCALVILWQKKKLDWTISVIEDTQIPICVSQKHTNLCITKIIQFGTVMRLKPVFLNKYNISSIT